MILAGISIATLTGENGVLNKASKAGEETKKAKYEEILKIIGNELQADKILEHLTNKDYMDRYEEKIKADKTFEEALVTREDDETIQVITKEGYVYLITMDKVEYIGIDGEKRPPNLKKSDVEFKVAPSEWTKNDVSVEIISKIEGYTLQYSIDNRKTWSEYLTSVTMTENGTIYARLWDGTNGGGSTSENITNIDKTGPKVSLSTEEINSDSIKLIVTANDEQSGLAENGTYQYYLEDTLKATETSNYYTFTGVAGKLNYTLRVVVKDKLGNETQESIEIMKPLSITNLIEGNYVNYVDKKGIVRKSIVLYNNSDYGIQIITEDTVEDVILGDSDFNTARESYNNVESILDIKANEYLNITYASGARCVGSSPNNTNLETGYYSNGYGYMSDYNGTLKNADTNDKIDYNKMRRLGIANIDNRQSYWIPSRYILAATYSTSFYIYGINASGNWCHVQLCEIQNGGINDSTSSTLGLRPVFTLKPEIKIIGGTGTSNDPYILGE